MKDEDREVTPFAGDEDRVLDIAVRPTTFEDYVGQERVKENLTVAITAARARSEPVDHLLLHGPPGLGKTSLARLIALEMGVRFHATAGPAVERAGDLAAILSNLDRGDVLFIDEIHRLNRSIEEVLYTAMEDFKIDLVLGEGPGARSVQLPLKPFTLIAATTRTGLLTSPLRNRFGASFRLDYYSIPELERIVRRSARILSVEIDAGGASELARRARGTPRIANRWLRRARDFAQVRADGVIRAEVAREALKLLDVDELGLEPMDRTLLSTIIDKFSGGPVGLETLAASVSEESDTVEEVYEPYLLQQGFLQRTPKGRLATDLAYRHLGRTRTRGPQGELPLSKS